MRRPAPRPCGSCPYRRDVPSGVWDASEYEKLPESGAEAAEHGLAQLETPPVEAVELVRKLRRRR